MGGITGGTIPALIWKDVMQVATEPYGNSDFEYPEIILNPFKASGVSVIPQNEAKKAFEEQEKAELEEANKKEAEQNAVVKPDSIKPMDMISPIKKREVPTVEVKQERVEAPKPELAPIPMTAAPVGQ